MLWMGKWVYPYTVTPGHARGGFWKIELSPSPSDVVMLWLRLQTHLKCIPHPCHTYTKRFITLICRGWAYGCTLTLLRLWKLGVYFGKLAWLSWSDVVMSWLRFQTPAKCIPHPYQMYSKCFSTLIYCGWAHDMSPPLHCYAYATSGGGILGKLGYG